jgi:hypothetical protein
MTNWAGTAPAEPKKSDYLHDRSRIPPAPRARTVELGERWAGMAIGFLFAMGFMALAFQTRASWGVHRDWVVPTTAPFWAIGGVALGHLLARRAWTALGPGVLLLALGLVFTVLNLWRSTQVEGSDTLRDVLTIITAVVLGLSLFALAFGAVWVEARQPRKAPPPAA